MRRNHLCHALHIPTRVNRAHSCIEGIPFAESWRFFVCVCAGGGLFELSSKLKPLGMPSKTCTHDCGSISINGCSYNLAQINVRDGHDACNNCNCDLAYVQLAPGEALNSVKCGNVQVMTYSPNPAPGPPGPAPSPPRPGGAEFDVAGLSVTLATGAFTVESLNKSVPRGARWNKTNDFNFVGGAGNTPRPGCHHLGDITIRVAPVSGSRAGGAGGTPWAIYDSAMAQRTAWSGIKNVSSKGAGVVVAHDITAVLNASTSTDRYNNTMFAEIPLRVVREWRTSTDGAGLVMEFTLTNTWTGPLELGGLGFPMPQAGQQHGIEESVWLDPHIGGDHGFVEWVRVVVDEQTLMATAEGAGTPMEGWRPLMEGCTSDDWEWAVSGTTRR